ncbi:MAG: hypothetical protein JJE04_04305 [Acidobacteriia bacterium]|nr:hypothetical protein [Terriglobia bacterium]
MERIRAQVNWLINNGQVTERGLAKRTGISQPHIHNVLKGARNMTPEIADLMMRQMKISLLDLLGDERAEVAVRKGPQRDWRTEAENPRETRQGNLRAQLARRDSRLS